jgi:threonine dehydrogenase-like Zn-dependent dehydrogenase
VDLVASGGRIVIAGVTYHDVSFPGRALTKKEIEIHGTRNNANCFPSVIAFLDKTPDIARRFISGRMPFERIVEAFHLALEKPNEVTKLVLEL